MDLDRMLLKCVRDQWSLSDLDFTQPPRAMTRADEEAIVQYFTDMAGIERLAAALFVEQERRAEDPTLRKIFQSFVRDEMRHSVVATRLAQHYDVHRYRKYLPTPHFLKFHPAFVEAIRYLTPEIANVYITVGEIILDVALLRSLNDYVDDRLSDQAMTLINRDESRHIAVDFHMVEYYSSDAYAESERRAPRPPLGQQVRAYAAVGRMLFHGRPFLKAVFFDPMAMVDPSGARLREAFKRIQLVATKPNVARRPFVAFMLAVQAAFRHPILGAVFGRLLLRILGTSPDAAVKLYDEAEAERARSMSFDELAEEVLGLKTTSA